MDQGSQVKLLHTFMTAFANKFGDQFLIEIIVSWLNQHMGTNQGKWIIKQEK